MEMETEQCPIFIRSFGLLIKFTFHVTKSIVFRNNWGTDRIALEKLHFRLQASLSSSSVATDTIAEIFKIETV